MLDNIINSKVPANGPYDTELMFGKTDPALFGSFSCSSRLSLKASAITTHFNKNILDLKRISKGKNTILGIRRPDEILISFMSQICCVIGTFQSLWATRQGKKEGKVGIDRV